MPSAIDYSKLRVLLIDSSGNLRSTIKSMLESLGFARVRAVTISERVLDDIAENEFDIILLGHNIHDRYSGLQLLEEARFRKLMRPTCSWVLMSSDPSQESMLFAIEVQPDEVLIKPFTMSELRTRLDNLCHRRAALEPIEKAIERNAPNRAIKLCDSLLGKSDANYYQAQLIKGRLLLDTGQYQKAEAVFEGLYWAGKELQPGYYLAESQFHLGKMNEAQSLLEGLIGNHPLLIPAYDLLARVHEACGRLEQAQDTLKEATRRSPRGLTRQLELGRVATHTKNLDIAEQAYKKSISLGEHSCQASPDSFIRLANIHRMRMLEEGHDVQQGLTEIEKLLARGQRRFPKDPEIKVRSELLMAKTHQDLGEEERAAAYLELARSSAHEAELDVDLEKIRQQVLAEEPPRIVQQREEPAVSGKQQDPVMSAKVNRIGVRNYMAGKPGQAIRYFGMAFEHDKKNVAALLNLAQLFLEAARDTPSRSDERLKMFKRYMQLAQRLVDTKSHQQKLKQLDEFSTMLISNLPEGSLGSLLK
ncbi:tetratricopeptide repeat protein [Motiliproteus sp. MSK22-1]|uniref:tetratricopeptide repeat protein n=1 Tax=Motiliproteus sp. MSK22-1 TaxID=1897630 RepID=UPI00097AA4DE|nr:response regulator [Motiliproteus sp. MSK22-1]OMH28368.1 hypothetical protein BGP75_20915 [Motiliproteus sp. MSK22-1]